MENKKTITSKVIPMSAETKTRLVAVAEKLKDRELFPHKKIEAAKKALSKIKTLPI